MSDYTALLSFRGMLEGERGAVHLMELPKTHSIEVHHHPSIHPSIHEMGMGSYQSVNFFGHLAGSVYLSNHRQIIYTFSKEAKIICFHNTTFAFFDVLCFAQLSF
jgi:hypothetical protein